MAEEEDDGQKVLFLACVSQVLANTCQLAHYFWICQMSSTLVMLSTGT